MREKSKGKRVVCASTMFTAAIIVAAAVIIGIAPVSAAIASVTRDLPLIVDTNEEFEVTLTQTGFFMGTGTVYETLPDGFEYVAGSYTGSGDVEYNDTTRELTVGFRKDSDVGYRVKASSYPQLLAVFEGTYYTVVLSDPIEPESGPVGGRSGVIVGLTGSVSGTITYASNGTGVEGATVKLTQDGAEIDSATTDASGDYEFADVTAGDYYVNASKSGFWENAAAVTVTGGATATADMMLWLKGDFNTNGAVDIGDVAKVANMVVGNVAQDLQADFNGNGDVDIGDAAKIANYFVGNIGAL